MNPTLAANPSIVQKADHICHITTNVPLIAAGAYSVAYTWVVAISAPPIARPGKNRDGSEFHHE